MFSSGDMARATRYILGLVTFVGFVACQSAPSPIIVGDTYTNIQYEYSLRIPRGWEPQDAIPAQFSYFETLAKVDMNSLLLYNEKTGGLIAIMSYTNRIAYETYFDVSYEKWEQILLANKSSIEGKMQKVAFDHSIYMDNLNTTQLNYFLKQFAYKPERFLRVESSFMVEAQRVHYNFDTFLYPCRNNQSCEATIFLTCFDENLAQNQAAFEALLSSLQAHDYYD
jgi:hypothetical protein